MPCCEVSGVCDAAMWVSNAPVVGNVMCGRVIEQVGVYAPIVNLCAFKLYVLAFTLCKVNLKTILVPARCSLVAISLISSIASIL